MHKLFFTLLCLYLMGLPLPGWALPHASLSLSKALQRAEQHSPELQKLRQEQTLWDAYIIQASLGFNPELSLVAEDIIGSAAFTEDRFTQVTAGLSQTLMTGDKRAARVQRATLQKQLNYWEYQVQRQYVGLAVHKAYLRLHTLQTEKKNLKELQHNAEEINRLIKKAVLMGKLSPADTLQSEINLAKLASDLQHLVSQELSQRYNLALLWGDSELDFEDIEPLFKGDLLEAGSLLPLKAYAQALGQHPKMARWDLEGTYRQASFEEAKAEATPNLDISGGLRYHPPLSWGAVLSIGMPIPLFNANQGNIQAAQLRQNLWQKERSLEEHGFRNRFHQAHAEALSLKHWVAQLEAQLSLAQQEQALTQKSFQAGRINTLALFNSAQKYYVLSQGLPTAQEQ